MAPRAEKRVHRPPRRRLAGDGYFFPNEVVRILHLERVDYRQLRRLFRLVRAASGRKIRERKWARYSFQDLCALQVAIDIAGGIEALASGRRLGLKALEAACRALRDEFKLSSPLTQALLQRQGRVITAQLGGMHFVPQTGQLVFGTLQGAVGKHLKLHDKPAARGRVMALVADEKDALRKTRVERVQDCGSATEPAELPLRLPLRK
jgi:hypothetical protein